MRNLKQALNHRLALEKNYIVIKFNQNAQLKPYIDRNIYLRKEKKENLEKRYFKADK